HNLGNQATQSLRPHVGSGATETMKLRSIALATLMSLTLPLGVWAGPAAVEHIKGHADRRLPNSSDWNSIDVGDRIPEGSEVRTDPHSELDLVTDQGHRLHVGADTAIVLSALQPDKTKTYLNKGKVLSKVVPLKSNEKFLIQTPSAVCAVRGTEFWTGSNDK